jgi:hypothetical protein
VDTAPISSRHQHHRVGGLVKLGSHTSLDLHSHTQTKAPSFDNLIWSVPCSSVIDSILIGSLGSLLMLS